MVAQSKSAAEEGFATADALVAMLILAVTIILSVQAATTARRLSAKAGELHQASLLLDQLLSGPNSDQAVVVGASGRFIWRLKQRKIDNSADTEAPAVCELKAILTSRLRGGVYAGQVRKLCSTEVPNAP